jgi:hypothetical protein
MRNALFLLLSMLIISPLRAQEQEKKLVDRLLRPDMNMKNAAQGKNFAVDGAIVEREVSVKSFYVRESAPNREYPAGRQCSVMGFFTRHFHHPDKIASTQSDIVLAKRAEIDAAASALDIRAAVESDKAVTGSVFKGNRPFLDKGKSQKALSQHDTPLTVEQVRELLNKNK